MTTLAELFREIGYLALERRVGTEAATKILLRPIPFHWRPDPSTGELLGRVPPRRQR